MDPVKKNVVPSKTGNENSKSIRVAALAQTMRRGSKSPLSARIRTAEGLRRDKLKDKNIA
jgi:hypothetical protein